MSDSKNSEEEMDGPARVPPRKRRPRASSEEVAADQRRRMVDAMARSVARWGYAATSVERVIEAAGVSRATFYEHFGNRQECLMAAHEAVFQSFVSQVSDACAEEETWKDRTAAAIGVATEFARRSPEKLRLLALDTIAVDGEGTRRGLVAGERLASMLRAGREHHPKAAGLPEVTERALVGAVASALTWALLSGESPAGLEPQLVQLVLTPYLGATAAARHAAKAGGSPG